MGSPSAEHERIQGDLVTLAVLAGYAHELPRPAHAAPDVYRVDVRKPRVLIADAKWTEGSDDAPTVRRLRAYGRLAADWWNLGVGTDLLIGSPDPDPGWLRLVRGAFGLSDVRPGASGQVEIAAQTWVSWARFQARHRPPVSSRSPWRGGMLRPPTPVG